MADWVKRIVVATACLIIVAVAAAGPIQAQKSKPRLYFPDGSVDSATLIGPPPAADSVTRREQMAIVLWLQRTRTPAQVAFVEKPLNLERLVPILGRALVAVDGIQLKQMLDAAISEIREDYDAVKAKFDEPRPFVVNDAIHPVGDARPVTAYPSGHSIRAIVYARLLAVIFPDRKDALMAFARQVGYGRVVAGVHYPMDVLSGQKLGHAYADVIVKQKAFEQAVDRIRGK